MVYGVVAVFSETTRQNVVGSVKTACVLFSPLRSYVYAAVALDHDGRRRATCNQWSKTSAHNAHGPIWMGCDRNCATYCRFRELVLIELVADSHKQDCCLFEYTREYGCCNTFSLVCLSVCLHVCLCVSVCPVRALTFESLDLETSFR